MQTSSSIIVQDLKNASNRWGKVKKNMQHFFSLRVSSFSLHKHTRREGNISMRLLTPRQHTWEECGKTRRNEKHGHKLGKHTQTYTHTLPLKKCTLKEVSELFSSSSSPPVLPCAGDRLLFQRIPLDQSIKSNHSPPLYPSAGASSCFTPPRSPPPPGSSLALFLSPPPSLPSSPLWWHFLSLSLSLTWSLSSKRTCNSDSSCDTPSPVCVCVCLQQHVIPNVNISVRVLYLCAVRALRRIRLWIHL